ncbi:hypothetical protein T265_09138 [Opisthorchis viverrini]|uniref:Uncharacterized protein n=1 Tax=Opisthorchis viverrini TaxID=6198 RepID=A0A074ZHV6_OPIVI|nr:hypothetical protein T265_09138 [Opisthorchis viverrini]KER22865.1 hypothetical protein T265_09138 [Opisthorchis viverrini]
MVLAATVSIIADLPGMVEPLETFTQAIWIETDNKNATDIGWQPYPVVSSTRRSGITRFPSWKRVAPTAPKHFVTYFILPAKSTRSGTFQEQILRMGQLSPLNKPECIGRDKIYDGSTRKP